MNRHLWADLVRFWYAALFLFASAYTLIHDGHVRVDVIYAGFSEKAKNRTNMLGSLLLGLPLCWIVLFRGLWSESSPFNLALLNFEVTQPKVWHVCEVPNVRLSHHFCIIHDFSSFQVSFYRK